MEYFTKEIEKIIEEQRTLAFISGRCRGTVETLFEVNLPDEERIRILRKVAGLSDLTAREMIAEEKK